VFLAAVLLVTTILAGCGSQPADNENAPVDTVLTEESPGESSEQELFPSGDIVFDDTIKDPLAAMMGGGAEGEATIKLTLYETGPGVYSGDGMMVRTTSTGGVSGGSKNASEVYYRLSFHDIRANDSDRCVISMFSVTDSSNVFGSEDRELGAWDIHMRSNQKMPSEYQLAVKGDSARLFINTGIGFEFTGSITQDVPVKPGPDRSKESCISVNSIFYETGNTYNHEYRAMLTATGTGDSEYSGALCVHGSGEEIPFIDEDVVFSLQDFDRKTYEAAGGVLPGSFNSFGVIGTPVGDYILLLDGERPLIEPAGSDMVFYGTFIEEDGAEEARRIAEETKQLMQSLYNDPDPTKSGFTDTPEEWSGKAPWYPDWLMPLPISASDWYWHEMMNELGYSKYRAQYKEDASIEKVFENYTQQLSGYERFKAYDPGGGDAAVYFVKGSYSVMIMMTAITDESTGIAVGIT